MDCGRKTVETPCAGQTGYIENEGIFQRSYKVSTTPRKAKAQTARIIFMLIIPVASVVTGFLLFYKGSEFMDTGDSSTSSGGRSTCFISDEFIILNSPNCIGN